MITKIKKTKSNRGRPKKDFSVIDVKKNNTDEPRLRGRPRKETRVEESINTKIHNHTKEINKISRENENLSFKIQDTSFVNKKIDKPKSKKSDNIALGLLIFSMIVFIFSLYNTFFMRKNHITNEIISKNNINHEVVINTGKVLIKDVSYEANVKKEESIKETKTEIGNTGDYQIINVFYNEINGKNFSEINNLVDNYLKSSNVFKTYYNSNWLSKFIGKLANQKVYLTNIKEINLENKKEGVSNYSYVIKYKLNDNNELFQEEWEAAVVTKGDKKIIGSLRCITTGCSKMPFFNLPRYEK